MIPKDNEMYTKKAIIARVPLLNEPRCRMSYEMRLMNWIIRIGPKSNRGQNSRYLPKLSINLFSFPQSFLHNQVSSGPRICPTSSKIAKRRNYERRYDLLLLPCI